jgi:hypothetical protein
MYIGYIVNDLHPCLLTIPETDIDKYVGDKPILIVGFSKAAELYPHINLSNKAIDEKKRIYYSFSQEESEAKHQENLNNFISNCFITITKKYKVINITSLTDVKIDFKEVFINETPTAITITGSNKILYINKEISSFFNKEPISISSIIEHFKTCKVIAWEHREFFGAYLKANNCYKSKEQIRILFNSFGDIDLYMGALCLSMNKHLVFEPVLIELWQRAYQIETSLSQIKIKVNEERIKELASDDENTIAQNIYKAIENGYITQKYNGTDKITGRIYPTSTGFSLQSLSKNFRDIIVAEPGCILVEFDYKSFEYKLLSQLCKVNVVDDPHLQLSQLLFKDDLHRAEGKNINYSLLYGKSIDGTIEEISKHPDLKISKEELKVKLLEITSPMAGFQKKLDYDLKTKGFITNHFGRNIHPEKSWASLNNFFQSSAADILILKLTQLKDVLKNYPPINKVVLQNHDSILMNLSIETIETTNIANEIKDLLEMPENGIGSKVDLKYGENYRDID